jgi:hypothetical protein
MALARAEEAEIGTQMPGTDRADDRRIQIELVKATRGE